MSNYHLSIIKDSDYERKIHTIFIKNHSYISKYFPDFLIQYDASLRVSVYNDAFVYRQNIFVDINVN
jgi:hypothetical protein